MKKRLTQDRPVFDLVEEAVHLLRTVPLHFFAWYLLGVLPFLLALLYFWTDMSWSAVAFQHRAESALGVALLFLWMKCAQSVFCRKLRIRLTGQPEAGLTWREILHLGLYQTIFQPSKLFLLPLAALATVPFGWVWAFYESVTALGAGNDTGEFFTRARRQAAFWPRQNHGVLLIDLLLLGVVFLNVAILVFLLPYLLRMFTGVETFLTQSPRSFMNTTSLAFSGVLTYLVCDPLLKATYTLRCFQADSLHSGEDLAAELRRLPRLRSLAALFALTLLFAPLTGVATPSHLPEPRVTAEQMNRAIEEAMKEPRFSWRLPRQVEPEQVNRRWPFVNAIDRFLKASGRMVMKAIDAFLRWLGRLFSDADVPFADDSHTSRWQISSRSWMIAFLVLLGLAAAVLVVQAARELRLRRNAAAPVRAANVKPDLTDENASAELLPEEEWLALAREHLARGELRLALRAFFFATLAHLGTRELLTLAKHKSNRDYARELRRRASDQPPLLAAFQANVLAIERAWYGEHPVDRHRLAQFEHNLEAIRKC